MAGERRLDADRGRLLVADLADLFFGTNGTNKWRLGHPTDGGEYNFVPITGSSYDIGTSSRHVRAIYVDDVNSSNLSASRASMGTGAATTGGLILLKPGYQTFGEYLGTVLSFGPTYYDPNNGQIIRMGSSIYFDGDGVDNTINGGDATHPKNQTLATIGASDATYNLATGGPDLAQFPVVPGTVRISVILAGGTTFSEVTDNGAGVFPAGSVLPAGGTVNYTTGAITGVTATLESESRVTAYYVVANTAGENLTPRGGDGVGTGIGGELRLRGGNGGATANGGAVTITGGAGGSTSGDAAGVTITGGTPVSGHGASIEITGSDGVGTNKDGGDISLTAGAATGSGTRGAVFINTSSGASHLNFYDGPASTSFSSQTQDDYMALSSNIIATLNAPSPRGDYTLMVVNQTNSTSDNNVGVYGYVETTHTSGTKSLVHGLEGNVYNTGSGNIANISGVVGFAGNDGSGTVDRASSFRALNATNSGTLTDNVGLYINDRQNVGTNRYAIYYDNASPFVVRGDGRVGIGTNAPATSAALEVSTTTGAVLLPRMNTTQRDALTAVNGMLIYNSETNKFQGYENGVWTNLI